MTTRGRAVGSMSAVATQEPQPFNTATWLKDSVAAIAAAAERWGHCVGCAYISMRRVKTSAIVVLMAVMQLVFIVCALALGFVLGVRRLPPTVLHPLC